MKTSGLSGQADANGLGELCSSWIPSAEELSFLEGWSLVLVLQLEDDLLPCVSTFSGAVQCCPGVAQLRGCGLGCSSPGVCGHSFSDTQLHR